MPRPKKTQTVQAGLSVTQTVHLHKTGDGAVAVTTPEGALLKYEAAPSSDVTSLFEAATGGAPRKRKPRKKKADEGAEPAPKPPKEKPPPKKKAAKKAAKKKAAKKAPKKRTAAPPRPRPQPKPKGAKREPRTLVALPGAMAKARAELHKLSPGKPFTQAVALASCHRQSQADVNKALNWMVKEGELRLDKSGEEWEYTLTGKMLKNVNDGA